MDNTNILQAFNDHFFEFINDIQLILPDNKDILSAKTSLTTMRKMNPRLIIKMWKSRISEKYKQNIQNGDISFFLEKDYSEDLENLDTSNSIINKINLIREPIRSMGEENQAKCMKYIQNLTKLSELYN
jgi:hypothetical protein